MPEVANARHGTEHFALHRQSMYSFGGAAGAKEGKRPPAPVSGGGGAQEAGPTQAGGGVSKGAAGKQIYLFHLCGALGMQRFQEPPVGSGRQGTWVTGKCSRENCDREHLDMSGQTKAGLLSKLQAQRVDVLTVQKGSKASIKEGVEK